MNPKAMLFILSPLAIIRVTVRPDDLALAMPYSIFGFTFIGAIWLGNHFYVNRIFRDVFVQTSHPQSESIEINLFFFYRISMCLVRRSDRLSMCVVRRSDRIFKYFDRSIICIF